MKVYIKLDKNNFIQSLTFSQVTDEWIEAECNAEVLNRLECYRYENGNFIFDDSRIDYELIHSQKLKADLQQELKEIHQWLDDNDWIVNKVFLGEWEKDDDRFLNYKKERAIKRARRDEILAILEGGQNGG